MKQYEYGYLNMATLRSQTAGILAEALTVVLDKMPASVQMVTLDLAREPFSEVESTALVEVMRQRWPRPAFCLTRYTNPIVWMRPAAALSQPLLAWKALIKAGGYQVFGRQVRGENADLLRALCYRYEEWVTAQQLANDPAIISPHRLNVDPHSLLEWATRGIAPLGPTPADVARISMNLRTLAIERYILQLSPYQAAYRAVHPVAPPLALALL